MIVQQIKAQTLDNHMSLENSELLRPIQEKSLTNEKYIVILKKFYGFFKPLEQKIEQFPIEQFLPDFVNRRKAQLLKQDINDITSTSQETLTICHTLPPVTTLADAFGCLYVMEGSTLGGKMIYKLVKDTLGFDYNNGAAFFYGYGTETGTKWKTFQQALTDFSTHSHSDSQIIQSANNTFVSFKNWIESY